MADGSGMRELAAVERLERETLLRMEAMVLEGRQLPPELLLKLSVVKLSGSPLLQLALGEACLAEGELARAQEAFGQAVKGLALLTLNPQLLTAMAGLARTLLRMGETAQAETLLQFLYEEYRRTEPKSRPGELLLALGEGCRIIGLNAASAVEFLTEAIDTFESESRLGWAYPTMFEYLRLREFRLPNAEWAGITRRLRSWAVRQTSSELFEKLILAFRSSRTGRVDDACRAFSELQDASGGRGLPYTILAQIDIELCRLALRHSTTDTEDWLRLAVWKERYPADHLLQLEVLKQMRECACLSGRVEDETQWFAEIQSLERILRFPQQQEAQVEDVKVIGQQTSEANPGLWRVSLFGGLSFHRGGEQAADLRWKRKKSLELFLCLLLQPRYQCPKEKVLELLGMDESPARGGKELYVLVHQLKHTLQEALSVADTVYIREGFVSLREDAFDYVDAERFLTLGRVADQIWLTDKRMSGEFYREAYLQYHELLPEYPYIHWLEELRETYRRRMVHILRRLARLAEEEGETILEEQYLQEWIRLQPYEEEAYTAMLRLFLREGRHGEARQLYSRWARISWEELGAEPSDEFRDVLEGGGAS